MQSEINDPALKNLLDAESEWCKHYLESQTHVEASFQDEIRKDEPQLLIARILSPVSLDIPYACTTQIKATTIKQ